MKKYLEMIEDHAPVCLMLLCGIFIMFLFMCYAIHDCYIQKVAMENGYVEEQNVGASGTHWVKP